MSEYWKNKKFAFINHSQCEFFPCHPTNQPEEFNCLFCYCPLYCLGDKCGGAFTYMSSGIKDCGKCIIPHNKNAYGYIIGKFDEVAEIADKERRYKSSE